MYIWKNIDLKKYFTRAILLLLFVYSPTDGDCQVTSFEKLDSLQLLQPKPVVIFIHAPWCSICEAMQETTLKDSNIVQLLENHFYFISLDSETTTTVHFKSHEFNYIPNGTSGIHELAYALGEINGELSFPTLSILNTNYEIIFQKGGWMGIEAMRAVLLKTLH